jgi:CheY-like chemotaxis protein
MAARILSISYDSTLLRTRQQFFEQRGYVVVSAEGFTEALERCLGGEFDVVVMGHSIPHRDKEALMRAVNESCPAPVVALLRVGEPPLDGVAESVESISPTSVLNAVARVLES